MVNLNLIIEILNVRAYKGKPEPKVAVGISKSIYSLDYNKNEPTDGFLEWLKYVSDTTENIRYKEFIELKKEQKVVNAELDNLETRFEQERILTNTYQIINH